MVVLRRCYPEDTDGLSFIPDPDLNCDVSWSKSSIETIGNWLFPGFGRLRPEVGRTVRSREKKDYERHAKGAIR